MQGKIIGNISNVYKIKAESKEYNAYARGKLKNNEITPLVGDNVEIQVTDEEKSEAIIEKVEQRKNEIKRPKISNIDQIIFVISTKHPKPDLLMLDKQLAYAEKLGINAIIIINKIDLVKKESLLKLIDLYQKEYNFEAVIPVSSIKSKYRDIILDEIEKVLKPGPAYYDVEEYTDQTMRQLAEETIREKALMYLQDEVPHGIYVEVTKMKLKKTKNKEEFYDIEATIYCLRESHKGIIIGKDGTMLKRIGQSARIDMERNFGTKVNLRTWVKVKENWLDDTSVVKKFKLQ